MPEPGGAPRILVVEDEASLARGIAFNLNAEGYLVDCIADGREATDLLSLPGARSRGGHDLVLLDVMLPNMDGFSVTRAARQAGNRTPILMLTAKGLPEDVVEGLESGADDYLPKPFDLTVLLARVKSLLRRRDWTKTPSSPGGETVVSIGPNQVDFANFEIRRGDALTRLTLLEAGLLRLLHERRGTVVTKAEILEKVWNLHPDTETRAVDNFVVRLRKYIEADPSNPKLLVTVRGAGYRLEAAD
ncbi:MAG: response regulator transcription factor [Vicinamibacteria bacterium]|nr:response regulator transcription factor [Vicinamibacteria bacterium]